MSYLTSIFQAILQALCAVLPLSESGHSAIFHDFAGRYSGAVSQLTGVIHIGIALGLIIVFWKFFLGQSIEFFGGFAELFTKKLDLKATKSRRSFMYMTCISFAFSIFLALPLGKGKNLFFVTRSLSYNGTILDEGIFFCIFAVLIFFTAHFLDSKKDTRKKITPLMACALGAAAVISICFAGLSPLFCIFASALLLGASKSSAMRYSVNLFVPILIVGGIRELCVAVTSVSFLCAFIALVISAVITFFAFKLLTWVINNNKLRFFAFYDATIGVVCIVTGIVELALK